MPLMRERKRGTASAEGVAKTFAALDDLLRLKHRARGFSFLPRQPVHSLLAGRHASRLRGRGLNFEELRRYVLGDDVRTVDWLATARLRSPLVRVYTEERDRPVLLLVDQRATMFFASRCAMKSVVAAEVAALAAWRVTSLGDRVGAVVFGDEEIVEVPPRARDAGVVSVLHEIVRQNARLGGSSSPPSPGQLDAALRVACRVATHDWLVCLITDAAGESEETARLVTRLTAHNDVLAIYIHDPLEQELPDLGRAVFSSGASEMEVDTSPSSLRDRFRDEHAARRAELATLSRKRAIPVLPVSTHRDVAGQLRDLIGKRTERRLRQVGGGTP